MAALNPEQVAPTRRLTSLLTVGLLVLALLLAIYIGSNVLSVLYGVVAPPAPPLPPGMDQVSHTSEAYGVDRWIYQSSGDACAIPQYIQDNGGACRIAPMQCGEYRETQGDFSVINSIVARCVGRMDFSIFHEHWWSLITRTPDGKNQLETSREVYWIGTGPQ